jgi:hypothetical protein
MTTRSELHRLVDTLPEPALPAAERSLTALEAQELAQRLAQLSPAALRAVVLFVEDLEADAAAPHVPPHTAPRGAPELDELAARAADAVDAASCEQISDEDLVHELGL